MNEFAETAEERKQHRAGDWLEDARTNIHAGVNPLNEIKLITAEQSIQFADLLADALNTHPDDAIAAKTLFCDTIRPLLAAQPATEGVKAEFFQQVTNFRASQPDNASSPHYPKGSNLIFGVRKRRGIIGPSENILHRAYAKFVGTYTLSNSDVAQAWPKSPGVPHVPSSVNYNVGALKNNSGLPNLFNYIRQSPDAFFDALETKILRPIVSEDRQSLLDAIEAYVDLPARSPVNSR